MGRPGPRDGELNWQALEIEIMDLSALADRFTEKEKHKANVQMPKDKAPARTGSQATSTKAAGT
ncbi:hypothetical protein E2562_011398 [Oryza meyeriana var. granulata]|uniref:Uncharacterized protein n=1 Tax=Oryza meyeriana var. granulata TaxID=110450 RepID=A0A6G1EAF8_9ORYZ|nr:hypothetical protein E2562_011398 [Oryza meyeriana var. granulata]